MSCQTFSNAEENSEPFGSIEHGLWRHLGCAKARFLSEASFACGESRHAAGSAFMDLWTVQERGAVWQHYD